MSVEEFRPLYQRYIPWQQPRSTSDLPEEFVEILPAAYRPRKHSIVSCECGRHNITLSFSARISFSIMNHTKAEKRRRHESENLPYSEARQNLGQKKHFLGQKKHFLCNSFMFEFHRECGIQPCHSKGTTYANCR